jgi:hypothetical protein
MRKADIIRRLHEAADFQLFGDGTWPANREVLTRFRKLWRDLGLEEDVPGSPGDKRSTALGMELNLVLMMAFTGTFDIWDIPFILEDNGYLEQEEVEAVWEVSSEGEGKRLVHRYVLRAYLKFCNRSRLLN